VLFSDAGTARDPILAAVGELQFDLVQARLRAEYGVETHLERLPYRSALVVEVPEGAQAPDWRGIGILRARDRAGAAVALFEGEWAEQSFLEWNPEVRMLRVGSRQAPGESGGRRPSPGPRADSARVLQ
jgi:peptide chain release factor 3